MESCHQAMTNRDTKIKKCKNQGCGAVTFLVGSGSGSGSGEAFRLRLRLRLRVKLFGGSGSGSDAQVLI